MNEKIHIYIIYFPTSDRSNPYYVGQTAYLNKRMAEHLKSGRLVCNAFWKYDDWTIEILHTTKDRDTANLLEIEEIRHYDCVAPNGYNLTHGGEGATHCEETKKKISDARKGTHASKETKAAMSKLRQGEGNSFYGRCHTKESNEKNRKAHIGRSLEESGHKSNCICCMCKAKRGETAGENNSMFGTKRLDTAQRNRNPSLIEQYKRLKNKMAKLEKEND